MLVNEGLKILNEGLLTSNEDAVTSALYGIKEEFATFLIFGRILSTYL
jgi:hypothetical protein